MVYSTGNGNVGNQNGHPTDKGTQATKTVQGELTEPKTDLRRWRLLDEQGRQTWHYLRTDEEVKEWPQSTADKYFLGLPIVCFPGLLASRDY